jgi:hypothetical protein
VSLEKRFEDVSIDVTNDSESLAIDGFAKFLSLYVCVFCVRRKWKSKHKSVLEIFLLISVHPIIV